MSDHIQQQALPSNPGIEIIPLGGVGQFGGNCLIIKDLESNKSLAVDCGARFLGPEGHGYRFGIPPIEFFKGLGQDFLGFAITHGHEDHIGALPFAHEVAPAPIWAGPFTGEMIRKKFQRKHFSPPDIRTIAPNNAISVGPFQLKWVTVNHSIPDAYTLYVQTPAGALVHSGDFRLELNPTLGPPTDFSTLSKIGDQGVLCLLSDSTLAGAPGKNPGERSVVAPTQKVFESSPGRLFVATFATHIQRINTIAECCRTYGRKLSILGRSMREKVQMAQQKGMFNLGDVWEKPEAHLLRAPQEQCWLLTGSQGETGSALWRLSEDRSTIKHLDENDTLLVSARVIPGNERPVAALLDKIADRGVKIFDGRDGRHVSGHGHREDMAALIRATKPKFFIPLHGGVQQLKAHKNLGDELGLSNVQLLELRNGEKLRFDGNGGTTHEVRVPLPEPWVNDEEVNPAPFETVFARSRMSQAGVLLGFLSPGKDQIRLEGRALGATDFSPLLNNLGQQMTDYLMEHYDLPYDEMNNKLCRMVNKTFRQQHKNSPFFILV